MRAPDPPVQVVVGVALLDRTAGVPRVLLGRRSAPVELAGCWEFPGGKVERGESEQGALRRECLEELAVEVSLGPRLGADLPLPGGRVLRVWTGTTRARPRALVHDELGWFGAAEVEDLPWIPADRPLLPALRALLAGAGPTPDHRPGPPPPAST